MEAYSTNNDLEILLNWNNKSLSAVLERELGNYSSSFSKTASSKSKLVCKKYKVELVEEDSIDCDPYVKLMRKISEAQILITKHSKNYWGEDPVLFNAGMKIFIDSPDNVEYKYGCLVQAKESVPLGRMTSNMINIGKGTGISVSKSKLNKDVFICMDTGSSNSYSKIGCLFAKDKENIVSLKLASSSTEFSFFEYFQIW